MNDISSLTDSDLLVATRVLVGNSCAVEADLLAHLGEIDARRLYLALAHSSMFAFCTRELAFSEGAAYNRIVVARAARKLPAMLDAVRSGRVHLAGLRLLAPHLTAENHQQLLAKAAGCTKDEIAGIVAALAPRPAPSPSIRRLPEPRALPLVDAPPPPRPAAQAVVPVADETFKVQFAISRQFRDELREAQNLLRHRIPDGDLAMIFRSALTLLIAEVKKQRFGIVRNPQTEAEPTRTSSRHIPDAIKRAVYQRDGGRCTFQDDRGHRCGETAFLEFDHILGFARTRLHDVDGIRLLCRAHNQRAAEQLYGHDFMRDRIA